ncbi:MAG: hypothetical protein R3C19_06900 [Planctomycetaceae bacterium]
MRAMSVSSLAFALAAFFVIGCGESRKSASVTGKVTLNGAPVSDVVVLFQPAGAVGSKETDLGMGSYGKTDRDGNFTMLFSDNDSEGAMIGEHSVTIQELTPEGQEDNDAGGIGEETSSRIPQQWGNASKRYSVKEGDNEANFELSQ